MPERVEGKSSKTYVEYYDEQADATGWLGPEVVFGLAYEHILPGDTLLDIGIGTGLGSRLFHKAGLSIFGMDLSEEMLKGTESKGFATELKQHDLTSVPYPYDNKSFDHAICLGVLQFFRNPRPVFQEAARIVRDGGMFAFTVADRDPADPDELPLGPEHTGSNKNVTMYMHDAETIRELLPDFGFTVLRELEFMTYMDDAKNSRLRARAFLAQRNPDI